MLRVGNCGTQLYCNRPPVIDSLHSCMFIGHTGCFGKKKWLYNLYILLTLTSILTALKTFKFFSGLLFTTAKVVFITVKIAFIFTSLSAVQIWLSYIHSRLFTTSRVYLEPTQLPAPSWLVSSVGRALHRYRKGHGFKSRTGLNYFQAFYPLLLK